MLFVGFVGDPTLTLKPCALSKLFPANINAMRPTPSTLKLPAKLVDELGGYGEKEIESINALG